MRRLAALAALSFSLLAVPTAAQAAVPSRAASYQFGYYYTLEACQYFGNSLVSGGAFSSYSCVYQWNSTDQAGYWYLYVY